MSIFTYNWVSGVPMANAQFLKYMHNIFNLRDTDIGLRLILVILKTAGGLNHHLNIAHGHRKT
jgi:hypothetical protein